MYLVILTLALWLPSPRRITQSLQIRKKHKLASSEADEGFLDATPPGTVRMSVADATDLGKRALARIGFSNEDADIILGQLIDNALCGYPFASLPRILAIAQDPKTKQPRKPVSITHETPRRRYLMAAITLAMSPFIKRLKSLLKKAKANKFAVVGAYDSYYSGRNAYFVEKIVNAGLVVIHIACGQPHVVPPGGTRPAMGTNPICIGFPTRQ